MPTRRARLAGMDIDKLPPARAWNEQFPVLRAVVIIRRGYLVAEWYANGARPDTAFNIHSCTKSFTGTAYGLLFEDSRQGRPPVPSGIDLDTPAYPHIPAGYPLTDPRKERITLRHLLSMSSGIPGESTGIFGVVTEAGVNPFEAALGRFPLKGREITRRPSGRISWRPNRAARGTTATPPLPTWRLAFRQISRAGNQPVHAGARLRAHRSGSIPLGFHGPGGWADWAAHHALQRPAHHARVKWPALAI